MPAATRHHRMTWTLVACLACLVCHGGCATAPEHEATAQLITPSAGLIRPSGPSTRDHYLKTEHMVPMRDGVQLFTAVYTPRDTTQTYPILMVRTPYSSRPYGPDEYRRRLGPSTAFDEDGYIFVYQDVRGCYMSEGSFVNMRPHVPSKESPADIDESSDTYDTIEWLLANVPGNNGRVGMWGISYPGFYASAGMADAHPALEAVSPQAPIADWWFDDFHHHGAFFLPHSFNFMASFGQPRPEPTTERHPRFTHGTPDGYQFFLDMGSLRNANERYLHGEVEFWNDIVAHPNYDEFWQARNILPHLNNVAPAVMTVGGWFDAEDLYGALNTYRTVEQQNPGIFNVIVMGPWRHGGWGRSRGKRVGNIDFGDETSLKYRADMLRPFFLHFLKGEGDVDLAEATVFETGVDQWRSFDQWPPADAVEQDLYLHTGGSMSFEKPSSPEGFDQYVSDPARPVPFTSDISKGMTSNYMTDDQRFAARRPDVLVYQTPVLESDVTLAGPIMADLWVSTSGTGSDWIVKLIDVLPPDTPDHDDVRDGVHLGGYQMMVRSEVMRGRFRNSYEHPEPFVPGEPTQVRIPLQDVLHTFRAGHRIMVQVQSTWFPLVDRNPQTYVDNIYLADDADFVTTTQRVYSSATYPSRLRVLRLAD